ncbi:hypothetical protein GGX14DRAFT_577573 [Mycena pura]|uniref:Uncharacterized protein n=1 Tax=Mycena pura TaxID=153505 RepID=A0AAD6URI6_9AGAR|nr:hypothetical protein GGX14DRAFT_577573 [Mycena pura]
MPAMHTVKYQNRWNPKKKRCGTQLANCFGSNAGFSALTSRPSARNKENTPTSPSSSHNAASPYRRTPTNLITSDDALLALRLRSKTYENRCRNLTRRVSRSVLVIIKNRKKQLEQRVQDLQKELNATRKSTSTYSASLQRQLNDALAELDNRKQNEIKLHARNLVLTRKQGALSKKVAQVPPLSKLKKQELANVVVGALERWLPRVASGEVLQMGFQVSRESEPENEPVESEEDDDDAGYGDQD